VVANERIGNRINGFRIGDRVDSDHIPLELTREEEDKGRRYRSKKERKRK